MQFFPKRFKRLNFSRIQSRFHLFLLIFLSVIIFIVGESLISEASANANWKMPWPAGIEGSITPNRNPPLHSGTAWGQQQHAYDIILPPGTPILAPVDSIVVGQCIASGSNFHRFIALRPVGSSRNYTLAHIRATSVRSSYRQGEQIGIIAEDTPKDRSCAVSYGRHLHFGFPDRSFTVDGQTFHPGIALRTRLRSTNGSSTPPSLTFDGGQSIPYIDTNVINLTVNARNLAGKTVYVQMWRDAVGIYPQRVWNVSLQAPSNSITFRDLDGSGPTFAGVDYYLVASLSPIPSGSAAQRRTACYVATGGRQLCDRVRR